MNLLIFLMRKKLREKRGTVVYVYRSEDSALLHRFKSKQHVYDTISIHHTTLNSCLSSGIIYLDTFFLSLDLIEDCSTSNLLSLNEIKSLVDYTKTKYIVKHPKSKAILAEFKNDPFKTLEFNSVNALAKHLKRDRKVIINYLKKDKIGYYKGV